MKLLVTGSEGSLMQAVIPRLISRGHTITGVDNFCRYGRSNRRREYGFVEGDLADRAFVRELFDANDFDGVIQAAARVYGVGGFHAYPADILANDVTLHQNILYAAVEHKIAKVCYVSSSMVFERCDKHPSAEADAFDAVIPATDYGLSKLVGERLCMAFARQYGLTYAIWRPFNVITPFETAERDQGLSHVFADFIQRIVIDQHNPLRILGDGSQVRCFTWIDDVAETIAAFSFNSATDNEVFNLGNPEPITMKQLAEMVFDAARRLGAIDADATLTIEPTETFADDVKVRIPDVGRAERLLGWRPRVKTAQAVERCVQHALA